MIREDFSHPGPQPEIIWVPLDQLVIDHSYQRVISSDRGRSNVARIGRHFSWAKFQVPTVARNADGKYTVIDGQHRVEGARLNPHVINVPVYVIDAQSVREQAEYFIAINGDRVAVHPLALHYAMIAAGNAQALEIKAVCDSVHVTIARQPVSMGLTAPRETMALGTIKNGIKQYGASIVAEALSAIADAYPDTGGQMRSLLIKAVMQFYKERGRNGIDRARLILTLQDIDPIELEQSAQTRSREHGGKTPDIAKSIVAAGYDTAKTSKDVPPREAKLMPAPAHIIVSAPPAPKPAPAATLQKPKKNREAGAPQPKKPTKNAYCNCFLGKNPPQRTIQTTPVKGEDGITRCPPGFAIGYSPNPCWGTKKDTNGRR